MKEEVIDLMQISLDEARRRVESIASLAFAAHENDNYGGDYFRCETGGNTYILHVNHDAVDFETVVDNADASGSILHCVLGNSAESMYQRLIDSGLHCKLIEEVSFD